MTREELVREYERRRCEAERHGYTARADQLYTVVLEDLRSLDGVSTPDPMMHTGEAAKVLRVATKTIRGWATDGRFPGATKTSAGGRWRIPAEVVYRLAGAPTPKRSSTTKLWTPSPKGGS